MTRIKMYLRALMVLLLFTASAIAQAALDPALLKQLSDEDSDVRIAAIAKISASGEAQAYTVLKALSEDALYQSKGGELFILTGDTASRATDGEVLKTVPEDREVIEINNRIRGEIDGALAGLKLLSTNAKERQTAALALQTDGNQSAVPLVKTALAKEQDEKIKKVLIVTLAALSLKSEDAATRLQAVKDIADTDNPQIKQVLSEMLTKDHDGNYGEPDEAVRAEAQKSLIEINSRLQKLALIGNLFSGISLGSILLLAALGLAITFGLMGIINMAHGELLAVGAYATYAIQNLFRNHLPNYLDWYVVVAVPVAFVVAAIVGMVLERTVIRWLYGRALETLLATWGISLLIIQALRMIFGAQNVEVANPSWMSGGIALAGGVVLPYNRIVIIGFSMAVLLLVWLLLTKTRMGLFVRAVTQNRRMASCVGVPTHKIDMLTFGLGSGIAGLGGVALSQIGNVGPELGQGYIVDSFMVVVLGGVGQLAGTVIAALGLGSVAKFLEPFSGAVLAKIFILVFIVLFIQKRPSGLFALKGRSVE